MVNEEKMALCRETGEKNWWKELPLPKNITLVKSLDDRNKITRF